MRGTVRDVTMFVLLFGLAFLFVEGLRAADGKPSIFGLWGH